MRLGEIAELVGGKLIAGPPPATSCTTKFAAAKIESPKNVTDTAEKIANIESRGAGVPEEAGDGEITMIDDVRKAGSLVDSHAIAVVTPQPIQLAVAQAFRNPSIVQIVVDDVHAAFERIVARFRPPYHGTMPFVGTDPTARVARTATVHPSAVIAADVTIGERTRIMPGVVVMPGSVIGDDCVLHSNVTIYEHTQIADRVIIHAGSILGANGFGYRQEKGRHVPTAQLGFVMVQSDVEIGAGVTIDRGTYGSTRIGQGTKIDNQVMIAHNCQIGKHNLICSQVGIAGSCRTGDHVILAGQVGLKDHVKLGDHAVVGAQAGVMDDLDAGNVYLGSPATTQRDQMQIMAVQRRLPEMRRELKSLTKQVARLQQQLAELGGTSPSSRSAA